ncbi:Mammalian cell entry related domain protein [Shewanella halifaxensis HAW-EB4]|uniref:Mammalian cell entry related domain protein n=1 Tax=Shewanella halifaxensis (strain HAW-EB4) TaxID=458817 RepID=B0TIZ4_SHEHH|nr:MlaD family protein [Shewanella halifaxensis]ABZ76929.1 Mammalian cell entry related domain protein [Shewanella halifaxensis HAW-EB4]
MTQVQTPKIVKKKLFSPIWLLPIIALALGAWLGVKSIRESGIEVTIHFPSATGMDIGKTLVKYQGLTVGKVVDMSIDDDLQGVNVDVIMDYRAAPFVNEGTKFWLVKPKATITGIEGLDTLFSGNYISILPGKGGSRSFFEAETTAPVITPGVKGLTVHITSDKLGSLDVGSPVFYRQIPVGQVIGYHLANAEQILVTAFIQEQYAELVKVDSQFWNVSGISIDASLSGVKVSSESLASILAGGISFSSNTLSDPAENKHEFTLYDSQDDALGGLKFKLVASGVEAVSQNTAIVYRGIQIGQITHKSLSDDGVTLSAIIDNTYKELLTESADFWLEGADISLSGIKHPERLITGSVINFIPGTGPAKQQYTLLTEAPDPKNSSKLLITLHSDTNPGVSAGAEIRYKQIKIGHVLSSKLNSTFTQVEYQAEIDADFASLVSGNSHFLAESALTIDANLDGVKVSTRDLTTLTSGALSLVRGTNKALAKSGDSLYVFASAKDATSFFNNQNLVKKRLYNQDAADLSAGSPIYYKKMQIGQVTAVEWQAKNNNFAIDIAIERGFKSLLTEQTVFWRNSALSINASLSGIEVEVAPLMGALKGGISLGLLDGNQIANGTSLYESRFLALSQAQSITLTFPATVKLASKAAIRYLGHKVGEVESVTLADNLKQLDVTAYLYGEYATNFNQKDASYSVVDADISLAGIKAPETMITGPYIEVFPGQSSIKATAFTGQIDTPFHNLNGALTFSLSDSNLGSVKHGTAIFFRGVKIGQVDSYSLSAQGTGVVMQVHIKNQYQHLVNQTSVFWDLSGVKVDVGLFSGAQIETGSLETILAGGIGVATQETTTAANVIRKHQTFTLKSDVDSKWLSWSPVQTPRAD